jgi:hypothetical protein
MIPINRHPSARDLRGFARLWFPLFVGAIGALLRWRFEQPMAANVVWTIGAIAGVAVLASTRVARAVFVTLVTVTYPIGLVVSTVALGVLFYLVLTPVGLVMRWSGRDPLRLRTRGAATEWQPFPQDEDPRRIFRQF